MIDRRNLLAAGMGLLTAPWLQRPGCASAGPDLLEAARTLSREPYRAGTVPLAPPFANLDYDAFRGIRQRPGLSSMLPHGPDFAFDLLPPGLYFPDPVRIDQGTPEGLREIAFSPGLFDFDPRYFGFIPQTSPGGGFSGLRLRHALHAPGQMHEVLVLQGASYFRAIGKAMVYGLSARAVAIGTGGAAPEEFPRFTHLRLHPAVGNSVRIEGLIDSPSLAAHLDMVTRPGEETVMDIVATLLPRVGIDAIGVAPLTSMFLKGPIGSGVADDFRPRVHDSDVLCIQNGAGEKLWRPIGNPAQIETSAFVDDSPSSFGLFQTRRRFDDFEDTEAHYHERASAMVRPSGAWGRGAVVLVEIPTGDEFMDNIVAFWRPEMPLAAAGEYRFAYTLTWTRAAPPLGGLAPIAQSRSGREHHLPGVRRYVIDFMTQAEAFVPEVSAGSDGRVFGASAFALPQRGGVRVTFLFEPGSLDTAELRLVLRSPDGGLLGPTWLHRWTRMRDGGV